jgi:methyl-accepting chemotaxis protein
MQSEFVNSQKQKNKRILLGLWVIRIAYIALGASALLDLFASSKEELIFSLYLSIGCRVIGAGALLLLEISVYKNKPKEAALTAIIAEADVMFTTGLLSSIEVGWLLGVVLSLMLSLIAIQLMPRDWIGMGIFISFVGAALVALTDYLNKSILYRVRLSDPQFILLIGLSVVMMVLVFSRFTKYPIVAKLVLAISSLSMLLFNILSVMLSAFTSARGGIPQDVLLSMNMVLLFVSQVSIILSAVTALLLSKYIIRPLYDIDAVAEKISKDGDLGIQSRVYYADEIGDVAKSFNHLVDTLNVVASNASTIAQGDLTVNFEARSEKDVLGKSFVLMTEKLRNLVGQIFNNSEKVSQASLDLAGAADFAGQAATQITQTMDQIAGGAIQQAEVAAKTSSSVENMQIAINGVEQGVMLQAKAVSQAAELTDQIVKAIQQVISDAKAGVEKAGQAMSEADGGAKTIQDTISGMGTVQNKVEISSQKVLEMKKRSDEIGNILEVIEEITSQINLLSLNAAIEAARAGEAGKGFAVVADEVRKLADKSTVATKEINNLIQSINLSTEEAVSSMNASLDEVKNGTLQAGSAGQALARIIDTVKSMQEQVSRISDSAMLVDSSTSGLMNSMDQVSSIVESNTAATDEMAKQAKEVANSVENIASISEENSASVEEVSSSVGEMSAQVVRVNESAQMLTEMANQLQSQVQQFKL